MISIVMPVYNTDENYLDEALSSVLAQTYTEFELICIDDHSTNAQTLEKLEAYVKRDKRITVVHLPENVGAAEARNTGLKIASGEYIIFLDADDIFDPRLLEVMQKTALKYDADVCVCGHNVFSDVSGKIVDTVMPRQLPKDVNPPFSLKDLSDGGLMYWWTAPWNQLCRISMIKQEQLYFQSLTSQNDVYFACMCRILAQRIVYAEINEPLVFYRFNQSGQISARRKLNNTFLYMRKIFDDRFSMADLTERRQILIFFIFSATFWLRQNEYTNEEKEKFYSDFKSFLQEICHLILESFASVLPNNVYYFINKEFASGWFYLIDDYDAQLQLNRTHIMNILSAPHKNIVIWGNGKRGQAMQKFLFSESISEVIVTDRNVDHLKGKNKWGFVMKSDVTLTASDIVIASNHGIYEQLKQYCADDAITLVDLEQYCELSSKFW